MEKELTVLYIETSAINYLLDNYSEEQIVFIRDYLIALTKGKICVSPITFWEIACTGDSERKEELIRACQLFFDNFTLFPDPIQILDIYLELGCPMQQSQDGFFENSGSFSEVWRTVATDLEKTILVGGDLRKKDKEVVKRLSSFLQELIKNDFSIKEQIDDELYSLACEHINRVYNNFHFVQEDLKAGIKPENDKIVKLAIFFAHVLLILGISFGNTNVASFWEEKGIPDIKDQIYYLITKNEALFYQGPLVYPAMTALAQVEHGTNRGLYKDCLHAMYMPYCNCFLSNDQHFLQLKEQEPHELWGRITSIESFSDELFNKILPEFIEKNGK